MVFSMFDKVIAVNVRGVFLGLKYVMPVISGRGGGSIIITSSTAGIRGTNGMSAYTTSKHAVIGLMRTAALEGAEYGITVNALCPAYVRTPLVEQQIDDQAKSRKISPDRVIEEVMLEPAAIKRLMEPEEVAETVAYLCGENAGGITGAAWTMDLGWTAR